MSVTFSAVRRAVAIFAAAVLVGAASCSHDRRSAPATTAPRPVPVPVPGITDGAIVIGSHQPITGSSSPGLDQVAPSSAAFFDFVNAHGGVYGRKITYVFDDDASDPAQAASVMRQLVLQNAVFASFNGVGAATHSATEDFLNAEKVPDLFAGSGCTCWNRTQFPWTVGFQPDDQIEGKILGQWVKDFLTPSSPTTTSTTSTSPNTSASSMTPASPATAPTSTTSATTTVVAGPVSAQPGPPFAYLAGGARLSAPVPMGELHENDDLGYGGTRGLDSVVPLSTMVARAGLDPSTVSIADVAASVAAQQKAGARIVFLFTDPLLTALVLRSAAQIGYRPVWVVVSEGADPATLTPLLETFGAGSSATYGADASAAVLETGIVSDAYLPVPTDASDPWIALFRSIHDTYVPNLPFDANVVYGMAVAYAFYKLMLAAGPHPTRPGVMRALTTADLAGPELAPISYIPPSSGIGGARIVVDTDGTLAPNGPAYTATDSSPPQVLPPFPVTPPQPPL